MSKCQQGKDDVFYYQHSDDVCNTTACSVSEERFVFETADHVCVDSCLFTKPVVFPLKDTENESELVRYTRCYDTCETKYYENVTYFLHGRPFEVIVCVTCSALEDTLHEYKGAIGCVSTCPEQRPYKKRSEDSASGVTQCVERCGATAATTFYLDTFVCMDNCTQYRLYNETAHGYKCVNVCPEEAPFVQNRVCVKGCPKYEVTANGRICRQNCDKYYYRESDGKYRCVDGCDDEQVQLGSECRADCPTDMYVENRICVKTCSERTAVQVLAGKRLCSADCLYFWDGSQMRCASDNKCPEALPYLKDDRECVESCGTYKPDIVNGNKVCTD